MPKPTTEDLWNMVNVGKPRGVRELLQEYGTEVRRADDSDYWIKRWLEQVGRLKAITAGRVRVVAPDVRFWNEARAIKSLGGLMIHVERSIVDPGANETPAHASETSLQGYPFDAHFVNRGSIGDLWEQVDRWVETRLC